MQTSAGAAGVHVRLAASAASTKASINTGLWCRVRDFTATQTLTEPGTRSVYLIRRRVVAHERHVAPARGQVDASSYFEEKLVTICSKLGMIPDSELRPRREDGHQAELPTGFFLSL